MSENSSNAKATAASAVKVAKAGWGAFSTAKDAVTAVTSPVRYVKDKALGFVASALLAALKATIGPKLAQLALDRMNLVGKTLPFSVPIAVPAAVATHLDDDILSLAQNVANEALAGPLELLGYRLGRVSVQLDPLSRVLTVDFEAGVMPVDAPAAKTLESPSVTPSSPAAELQLEEGDTSAR